VKEVTVTKTSYNFADVLCHKQDIAYVG